MFVAGSVLLASDGRRLLLLRDSVRIIAEFSQPTEPNVVRTVWDCGLPALAAAGLDRRDVDELAATLDDHGLLSGEAPERQATGVHPLSTMVVRSPLSPNEVLIVTATEALWLPRGLNENHARQALRFFVSRMASARQMAVYGAALSPQHRIGIAGDVPCAQTAATAFAIVRREAVPVAVSLADDSVAEPIGRLEVASEAGALGSGRLAVAEVLDVHEWKLDDRRPMFFAAGTSAFPHLGVLDPFALALPITGTSGSAGTRVGAVKKCLAEGIERFVGGDFDPGTVQAAAAVELGGEWLHPRSVIAYDDHHRERLGLTLFDEHATEYWVQALNSCGTPVMVPAALVYSPFPDLPPWLEGGYMSSNGMAAHTDPNEAADRAWLELVERDAFQRLRAEEAPPPQVAISSLPDELGAITEFLRRDADVWLLLAQGHSDVPVLIAVAMSEDAAAIGMAASRAPVAAARKAFSEAAAQIADPILTRPNAEEVVTPHDHAALYARPEYRSLLDWMLLGPVVEWGDVVAAPEAVMPPEAVIYRFSSTASGDLAVVKALVPGYVPITFGFDSDPTGIPTFREPLLARGIDLRVPLVPHPFA